MTSFDLLLYRLFSTLYRLLRALRIGGLWQIRAQTSLLYIIVLDFWIFSLFLNHSPRSASVVEERDKNSHILTPCEK